MECAIARKCSQADFNVRFRVLALYLEISLALAASYSSISSLHYAVIVPPRSFGNGPPSVCISVEQTKHSIIIHKTASLGFAFLIRPTPRIPDLCVKFVLPIRRRRKADIPALALEGISLSPRNYVCHAGDRVSLDTLHRASRNSPFPTNQENHFHSS